MTTKQQQQHIKELNVLAAIPQVLFEAHDNGVPGLNQKQMIEAVHKQVPGAGENLIRAKLKVGVEDGTLIEEKVGKSMIYALAAHPMYANRHG